MEEEALTMEELIRFDNLRSVLEEYAQDVVQNYQDLLRDNDSVASGKLINGVHFQILQGDHTFDVYLKLEDYWKYVEYGSKPHWPPVNKILEWIKVKPVVPRPLNNGKLPTQQQLAFLIGRKIATVGIKEKPMLRKTLDEINAFYANRIEEALSKDVQEALVILR